MRTTLTLDPDVHLLLKRAMHERGVSLKEAVNDAVRTGLGAATGHGSFRTATFDMGAPAVNLDQALRLAGELEDEELLRKQRIGK